ncbi:spore cortex biosynthesis protein YabQ [Paenibacillus sp. FSL H8-0537]|uniref:spore cortex biosynthesis protein YabQ n=1 Tax=Paenibacillus sp. FSL H8-0537 TaxID=2921399 RepID=UPI003100C130
MTLTMQWYTLAMMLLSGIGMGVAFDGYRVVSNELRFPRWWLPVLDIIYWLAASIIVFRVLYASNNGEVRAYVFLGLAIGVSSYYFLFSKPVIKLVQSIIRAIRALIRGIVKTVEFVIIKPILLLYKIGIVALGFGTAFTIFVLKIMLKLTRPLWLLLWWVLGPIIRPLNRLFMKYADKFKLTERFKAAVARVVALWRKLF